jgi:hypothetical protein
MTELRPTVYRAKGDSPFAVAFVAIMFPGFCAAGAYVAMATVFPQLHIALVTTLVAITATVIFCLTLCSAVKLVKTQARLEILGNEIVEYNRKGEPVAFENLQRITRLQSYQTDGLTMYVVTFESGNFVTFDSRYERDFTLQKIFKQRSGLAFNLGTQWFFDMQKEANNRPVILQPIFIKPDTMDNSYIP